MPAEKAANTRLKPIGNDFNFVARADHRCRERDAEPLRCPWHVSNEIDNQSKLQALLSRK